MPIVHAYRRTKMHTVEAGGQTIKFEPDADGKVLADVAPGPALDRLLELSEGYTLYGQQPAKSASPAVDEAPNKYVLISDGETVDLRAMDRAGLMAFIEKYEVDYIPRANAAEDTIRDKIVKALTGA